MKLLSENVWAQFVAKLSVNLVLAFGLAIVVGACIQIFGAVIGFPHDSYQDASEIISTITAAVGGIFGSIYTISQYVEMEGEITDRDEQEEALEKLEALLEKKTLVTPPPTGFPTDSL